MATKGFTTNPNLSRGDMGLAEIFASKAGNNIKIVNDDATCYLWDDSVRLWVLRNNKWIGNEVLSGMQIVDVASELKEYRKKKEKVLSYRGAGSASYLRRKCYRLENRRDMRATAGTQLHI